jgi:hypothetical protein
LLGGKIWQTPRICSWYQPRKSVTQLFRQYGQYGYWKVATLKKHGQPASVRQLVPGAFILALFTLLVVSLFAPALAWAPFLLLGTYLSAGIVSAAGLCRRHVRWDLLPYLPPVFAAYHFGFGCGYLRGVIDFLILNRRPSHLGARRGGRSRQHRERGGEEPGLHGAKHGGAGRRHRITAS